MNSIKLNRIESNPIKLNRIESKTTLTLLFDQNKKNEFGSLLPHFSSSVGPASLDLLKQKLSQEWTQIQWMKTSNQKVSFFFSLFF